MIASISYLCDTLNHGIFLHKYNLVSLHAYSDANWAGNKDDCIYTSAYIVYLSYHHISLSSKKQRTIACSSTKAKYRSVATAALEINWVCPLLTELGVSLPTPLVIYCDNVGAIYLCSNPIFHSRMKHVAIDYHFINLGPSAIRSSSYYSCFFCRSTCWCSNQTIGTWSLFGLIGQDWPLLRSFIFRGHIRE